MGLRVDAENNDVSIASIKILARAVTICLLGFISGILGDFSTAMVLSYMELVSTIGRSASAKIASTGAALILPEIFLAAYL